MHLALKKNPRWRVDGGGVKTPMRKGEKEDCKRRGKKPYVLRNKMRRKNQNKGVMFSVDAGGRTLPAIDWDGGCFQRKKAHREARPTGCWKKGSFLRRKEKHDQNQLEN